MYFEIKIIYIKPVHLYLLTMMFREFSALTLHENQSIQLLINNGAFDEIKKCPKCNENMTLNRETLLYRCMRRKTIKKPKKKAVTVFCNTTISARVGTIFENSNLPVGEVLGIFGFCLFIKQPRCELIMKDININSATSTKWQQIFRELCFSWASKVSKKIGGKNHIVEIDESMFGRRKYHRGRVLRGQWIFGGIDRETKEIFLEAVEDRTAQTLIDCIHK